MGDAPEEGEWFALKAVVRMPGIEIRLGEAGVEPEVAIAVTFEELILPIEHFGIDR